MEVVIGFKERVPSPTNFLRVIREAKLEEEKQAMAEFGSADSGARLGDILGADINKAREAKEKNEE